LSTKDFTVQHYRRMILYYLEKLEEAVEGLKQLLNEKRTE